MCGGKLIRFIHPLKGAKIEANGAEKEIDKIVKNWRNK